MIGDTMLFARPPEPNPDRLDLQTVLPEILKPLSGELKTANFSCDVPQPVAIFADRAQLAVVITELLRNSLEWQDNGGTIRLSATPFDSPQGPLAQIVIEDDGESFTEQDQSHLFDPFYCGRQAGRGLGFGPEMLANRDQSSRSDQNCLVAQCGNPRHHPLARRCHISPNAVRDERSSSLRSGLTFQTASLLRILIPHDVVAASACDEEIQVAVVVHDR